MSKGLLLKKFIVTIEETINQDFEVFAENEEQAFDIASQKYKSGDFILDNATCCHKQMAILPINNNQESHWTEF